MKKALIILGVLIIALGGFWLYNNSSKSDKLGDEGVDSDIKSIEVDGETYYEADYSDGDSATRVKDLTFTLPTMFTGIESDDDSVNQNLYVDKSSGVMLSISEQHSRSHKAYEKEIRDYLEDATDVEKFKVGKYTAYKFNYKEGKSIVECDFLILAGNTFYSGYMYHEGKVDDIQSEEPEALPLSDKMVKEFNKLCNSLAFK
ncbi:MAG: hypothetical protein Q4C80_04585 [Bacillota bacterium]|nr:hypothetical protein [Bacillota bacterium]